MFEKIYRIIKLSANICIIVITIEVSFLLIRNYWSNSPIPTINSAPAVQSQPASRAQNQTQESRSGPRPGMKVSYQEINWSKNGSTLLFVLSTKCGFCTASADFYRRVVQQKRSTNDNIQFAAIFPQDIEQSGLYLKEMGIGIQDVKQSMPFSVGASGFPTLMLIDNTGTIQKAWVGKLSEEAELEVLDQISRRGNGS
jgi:hypothetical protein